MKRARILPILLAFVCVLWPSVVRSQRADPPFDFYARGPYRESIPRPRQILGYDVGDFHTNYAMMERVIGAIAAAAPDRVRVLDIGLTNEHRMMHLVVISAPENIAQLERIKADIARLADPRKISREEAERIIATRPAIVWLAYTIHGNESASFEAMMQVVYQLAASNEPATLDILRNLVVLIVTGENPDGHERFVTWYNSVAIGDPEPTAAEHREPWSVWGRVNHYRFDLNRDNLASTQIETRHLQRAYLEWNPQVVVDHHGQPSQFFFPPAALPINPNLPTEQVGKWLTMFGRANASAFDAQRWDYYVRDVFDLFYPGYWDSWPSLNGAIGMTYETDGGGWKGLRWKRDDETIVTLRSAIAKHFIASMMTLETTARHREARLRDYYEFRRSAIEEGKTGPMRRFVILPGNDPGRAAELVDVLLRAGIEVARADEPFRATRAHAYAADGDAPMTKQFPAGAYIVDLAQPQKRLAKALLEPETPLDRAFVAEQLARFRRNERRGKNAPKEEYGFYDITAWSLPLAFGVEAYWTEDAAPVASTPLALPRGEESSIAPAGSVTGRASVAYLIPYESNGAASLIARLLQEDYKLAVATRTLNAGGRDWPRGTVVVRVSRNPDSIHERIAQLARETGAQVYAVNSGFAENGDTGIGSETVVSLKRPRIVVIADEPVNQTSYGALWWTLDRYGVEFTPMTIDGLKRAELDRYNVIILPDGSPSRYFAAFGRDGVEMLRGWAQRGGTLVCIKGAAVFAALKDVNLTSSRLVGSEEEEREEEEEEAEEKPQPTPTPAEAPKKPAKTQTASAEQGRAEQTEKMEGAPPILPPIASPSAKPGRVPEAVPGAIMRATIDRTTPLTYGYEMDTLPVLIESAYFFRPSKGGVNAVIFSPDEKQRLHVAGFIWPDNTEKLLRGAAYVIDEPTGRGHVILYAEDPNFRGFWRATTRLFFNSFLFQAVL
ncbi:M14 family zinc carboxypeptidase [Pyrinomonas methylaliphatogenes]|uniref:Zinc carboxypeptidase n=1 Tax=Pyrinomonas methylaliphatogenes TaxID=454194 RepID=A0A0B6WZZ1_9BACT|nr:M14 family zinc carboxypeptidase [Pyrinomonas methylaliphatogenes]CDM65730.1 Zinc carboxypeptidase [Pyrinomonas methylaliphatogenes]